MEVRIGVLLPRSDMFPKLSIDLLNGIKLPFKQTISGTDSLKFSIESIGNASDASLLQKIESMMLQDETDIIVCFCSFFMLENLVTIANSFQKPVIHVSLGARVLKPIHKSPYVVHQSLNLCHTSYISGKYAVEKFGKKVAILSSFYDGGYHLAEAFCQGVIENEGEIVYNYVSPLDYKSETFQTMIDSVKNAKPDALFALFSYKEGNKVIEKWRESNLDSFPVIAIPLMTDESIELENSVPENIFSIASWAFEEDTEVMKNFISNFKDNYNETPNIISLLGDEIGQIVLYCCKKEGKIPNKIADYIKTIKVNSARGELSYTNLNESLPKSFKIRLLEKNQEQYKNTVLEVFDSTVSEIIYYKMEEIPITGWKNPYICT